MEKLRVGVIGLGHRGIWLIKTALTIPEYDIVAVCDLYPDRAEDGRRIVEEATGISPFKTLDYTEILAKDDVDAVIVSTYWETHVRVAIDAMKAGKKVGMEVGGAYNLEELWELVDTYESTKCPFMFLENCCYGEYELMVTNMVRQGILGEISHCAGAYAHDLREEVTTGKEKRHYRLRNYIARNCENYPTHELGPIAKLLKINTGNRITSLVSMSSKSQGMTDYVRRNPETIDQSLLDVTFNQGDVVNTLIKCENGETIAIKLDTSLPRYYSREFSVHGTKGMYSELGNSVYLDGDGHHFDSKFFLGNQDKYLEKYSAPIWRELTQEQRDLGHGGIDFFTLKEFAVRALSGEEFLIDVYDAATWMAVTCLSDISIKESRWVEIPDFTRGAYKTREHKDVMPLE
jgi:hypothetical protein